MYVSSRVWAEGEVIMQLTLYGRSKKLRNIIKQCNPSTFHLKKTQESDFNTAHFKFLLPSHLLTIHL